MYLITKCDRIFAFLVFFMVYNMCVHKLKLFLVFLLFSYKLEMYVAWQFVNCKWAKLFPAKCRFIDIILASSMAVRLRGLKY